MNRKLKLNELGRSTVAEFETEDKIPIIVILDNIRSLSNVGSIFRTADCFAIQEIHLCGITPRPPHREIQKTAIGATQSVKWKYFENTIDSVIRVQKNGFTTYAIEQAKTTLKLDEMTLNPQSKHAIVMGNEVEGVNQHIINLCDFCLEIKQFGTKHSFNVSVCTSIVLYEFQKQLRIN